MKLRTIEIVISGESGKTTFLNDVLLPALYRSRYRFVIDDYGNKPLADQGDVRPEADFEIIVRTVKVPR